MKRSYASMCASFSTLDGGDAFCDTASDSSDGHSDGETTTDTSLVVERGCSPSIDSQCTSWGCYYGIAKHHGGDSSRRQWHDHATYTSSWHERYDSWHDQ